MKYYIVYFENQSQDITQKGYYVGWKNKGEDYFSDNYIFAKRYKSLGPALSRAKIDYTNFDAIRTVKNINLKIEKSIRIQRRKKLSKLNNIEYSSDNDINLIDILPKDIRIEALEIDGNDIEYLGVVTNKEIYEFIIISYDKNVKKYNYKETVKPEPMSKEDEEFWNS